MDHHHFFKNEPLHFHGNQINGNEPSLAYRFLPSPDDRHGQPWDEDLISSRFSRKPPLAARRWFFIFH